jgi:transcription antitermination factor NusG
LFYSVPGVIKFLDHSREEKELPSPLSPQQIAEFSDLLKKIKRGETNYSQVESRQSTFQTNADVEVVKGPLAGCKGEIIDINEEKKLITININFLGRLTPTKVLISDCILKN